MFGATPPAGLTRDLRTFASKAEWDVGEDKSVGTAKELVGRQVTLVRLENRWFLANRQEKEKDKEKAPEAEK